MWSNSKKESPQIERLELRLPEGQELKEDKRYHLKSLPITKMVARQVSKQIKSM